MPRGPVIEPLEGKALLSTKTPPGCSLVMFDGAVRSSKTVSTLLMWCEFLRRGPQGQLAMIARTETAAINNLVMPLQQMLGTKRVVLNRGLGIVTIFGRVIQLYGANDVQAVTKIQGSTLAGAYVDEGANIPEAFFNMLRSRLSVPGAMLFLTCNPEGPKHWLKVNWLNKAQWHLDKFGKMHHYEEWVDDHTEPDGRRALHLPIWRVTFLLDDNLFLARHNPKFVRDLKASWPVGSVFYRRYILSEWVSAEGAVYGVWDEPRMTLKSEQLPRIEQVLIAALDYGTTHDTRAYLLGMTRVNIADNGRPDWEGTKRGVDPARARTVLIVLDEFSPDTATVGEHASLFEGWLQRNAHYGEPEWIAVDPAAATFKTELFARGRSDVMNAHNAVVPGIQTVASLMHSGNLFVVADRCPFLLKGIPGYMWDVKASDKGRTAPIKANDDEVDALRYAVYTSRRYWRDQIPLAPISADDSEELAA